MSSAFRIILNSLIPNVRLTKVLCMGRFDRAEKMSNVDDQIVECKCGVNWGKRLVEVFGGKKKQLLHGKLP